MKQVIQDVRTGITAVKEIPDPVVGPGQVLVAEIASAISAGTERYVVDLARKSLLGKARQRPADVKRVLQKMQQEGVMATLTQVSAKLNEPMPLGYSAAGIVLECGAGVEEFKPGDRVAIAAPHAGVAAVGRNLCAAIPDGVTFQQAAYTSIAAIGLQGIRLAHLGLGDSVLVIGLGLIGQMCVCMLKAQGCRVFGTDSDPARLEQAKALGADMVATGSPLQAVKDFSHSFGVDAVILTAATDSNEPIEFAADACRPKGRIVLVGVVGLNIPRAPFFLKELEFTVSSSLGPGRSDPQYEDKGIDYPIGHARWTAQRNMMAVLDLMAAGKLPVEKLTTHTYPINRASEAYDLIFARTEPFLGVVIEYGDPQPPRRVVRLSAAGAAASSGKLGVSMIGAGNFVRLVMLPSLNKMSGIEWRGICTAKGISAEAAGNRFGFQFASTTINEIWKDGGTNAVFIGTRHNLHAELVVAALRAGKNVFVEKPLCITEAQLAEIDACISELGPRCPILAVGFNRRFSLGVEKIKSFTGSASPLNVAYRFTPGPIPKTHWTQDIEVGGGRIVGEACHAIDACVALTGSVPVKVYAESVAMTGGLDMTDDHVVITMRHSNGAVSSISYQAAGDRGFPPERIEVFGGNRTATLDNWKEGQLWSGGNCRKFDGGMDKGHQAGFSSFLAACRKGGAWPIPWEELRAVTWASLAAVKSLRTGAPVSAS